MELDDFAKGRSLNIEVINVDNTVGPSYKTKIDSIGEDGYIEIGAPIVRGVYYPIPVGAIVLISCTSNGIYAFFKGEVVGRRKEDVRPLICIKKYSKIEFKQRREYYRLKQGIEVKIKKWSFDRDERERNPYVLAETKDISGSGIRVSTQEFFEIDEEVEVEFKLDNVTNARGRVIWSEANSQNDENESDGLGNNIGIIFVHLPQSIQEDIIKYIFMEQRKHISKRS